MYVVSVDLETHLITRGEGAAPPPVIVSVHTDTDHYIARIPDTDWSFFSDPASVVVGANIAYDMSVLIRRAPHLRDLILAAYASGRILDVQVAHTLVSISYGVPAGRVGLDRLADLYCGVTLDKDTWRLRYGDLDSVPLRYWPPGAVEYALTDSWIARRVFGEIVAADEHGALGLLGHATYAAWGLHEAEIEGVRTHPVRARRLVASAEERIRKVVRRLERSGLLRKDGTKDTKLAMSYMDRYMRARGRTAPTTDTGRVSLSEESVEASGSKLLGLYVEHTQANKMRTAARTLLQGVDLPLQTRFNSCMETYRTSSSMPDGGALVGVQMQNPWRAGGYREVFAPDPGELFIGADYAMAEVYSLAQLCKNMFGFSVLGDTLNSGLDVHLVTAARLIGCTYEEILVHPNKKHYRQLAKALVFGVPGGLGARTMVVYARGYGVELDEQTARANIAQFKAAYPEVALYLDYVSGRGYPWRLTHPITGFVRGGVGYTDGANTGFQSLTAYYAKGAVARCAAARWDDASPLYEFKVWNFVHDEILMRGPAERAPAAALELGRIMCDTANEVLVDYPIRADPFVSDAWSKMIPDAMDVHSPWWYDTAVAEWRAKGDVKALRTVGEPILQK